MEVCRLDRMFDAPSLFLVEPTVFEAKHMIPWIFMDFKEFFNIFHRFAIFQHLPTSSNILLVSFCSLVVLLQCLGRAQRWRTPNRQKSTTTWTAPQTRHSRAQHSMAQRKPKLWGEERHCKYNQIHRTYIEEQKCNKWDLQYIGCVSNDLESRLYIHIVVCVSAFIRFHVFVGAPVAQKSGQGRRWRRSLLQMSFVGIMRVRRCVTMCDRVRCDGCRICQPKRRL